ncbi:MAG: hypothetical protein RBU30_27560 [Polyangia bacterium]|nr:hypothetical protein [Polyangia bacterium]
MDTTHSSLHQRLKSEGIAYPEHLLRHRYLVRVALTDAGGGSRSRSELQLRFVSQPSKALGKAWADRPGLQRGQIGAEDQCQSLPGSEGGPESKRCPMHFGGLGWRNLVTAFRSVRMRLVVDPNNNDSGHMVIWMAFDQPQTGMAHKLVVRNALPSLGGGKVSVELLGVTNREDQGPRPAPDPGPGPSPDPRPTPPPGLNAGWSPLGGPPRTESRASLEAMMRRDGVAKPSHLLGHPYLVRLSIADAGGGGSRRSEVVVRLSGLPKAALGTAWSDHRQGWGAQLGSLDRCRRLPRARNPYDDDGAREQPDGHVCPLQYNGLGWRNLIGGFGETEVMFVTAPNRTGKGNQLLWLAFSEAPRLKLRSASSGVPIHARVSAESFAVDHRSVPPAGPGPGPSPSPAPGPQAPEDPDGGDPTPGRGPSDRWVDQPGSHLQVEKNALYWTIRRDGFENPWHLLKARYLLRLEVKGEPSRRAETLVRFSTAPREAIGKGEGSSRSATQAGTEQACRKNPGRPTFCPLHYAGIGWRNLAGDLKGQTLLFVTDPGQGGPSPVTIVWLAFDAPEDRAQVQYSTAVQGRAQVELKRFRW